MMKLGLTQFLYFKEDYAYTSKSRTNKYTLWFTRPWGILVGEVTNFNNTNDGFAGYPNRQHDMLYIKVDKGEMKYRVHTAQSGWLACK